MYFSAYLVCLLIIPLGSVMFIYLYYNKLIDKSEFEERIVIYNMDELLYQMIFKRKSFHLFKETQKISSSELNDIEEKYKTFKPLVNDIKTDIVIVPGIKTSCKRGEEYCILLYSEKKDNYLQNIGFLGEQLDLFLTSLNIGTLWFGIGKPEEVKHNNLDFIIMIAIAKVADDKLRKDMYKSKRKPLSEIWIGNYYKDIGDIVRFAPSACNTQPWIVESDEKKIKIYRYKEHGKRGIMPIDKVAHYNRIDIGIFLLFIELCLKHNKIEYDKKIFKEDNDDTVEKTIVAEYILKQ